MEKMGLYSREPTWMRLGAQGHVAAPRGHSRAPAWCGGDTWHIFIFIIYRSSDYRKTNYYPSISKHLIYPIKSTLFLRVAQNFFDLFRSQDAWRHVDRKVESAMNRPRRCGGREIHLISIGARASNPI